MENSSKLTFEDKIEVINQEIAKRRGKWKLSALSYIDYDDISQIIRLHIHKKWDQWNQDLPIEKWLSTLIKNQIINQVRNHYGRLAPPCNGCPHNLSGDSCSFTSSGSRCSECPLYRRWQEKTQASYNIKLASSINSEDFVEPAMSSVGFADNIDFEKSANSLHLEMKKSLTPPQYKIYDLLVIQGQTDREVAKILKLKSNEKGKEPGYKHLFNMRNKFQEMARKIIQEKDIL